MRSSRPGYFNKINGFIFVKTQKHNQTRSDRHQHWKTWLLPITLGIGLFCYSQFRLDPRLIAQAQQPVFLWNGSWMAKFMHHPGGLIELFSQFLAQLCSVSWCGSLILLGLMVTVTGLTTATPKHLA